MERMVDEMTDFLVYNATGKDEASKGTKGEGGKKKNKKTGPASVSIVTILSTNRGE
jgi:hypothetical protein